MITQEYRPLDKLLAQAIVFAALVFGGVANFAIVAFADLDWFIPTLVYSFVLYVGWLKFFGEQGSSRSTAAVVEEDQGRPSHENGVYTKVE